MSLIFALWLLVACCGVKSDEPRQEIPIYPPETALLIYESDDPFPGSDL